ncbi:hypothetical protein HY29_10695 [Hyphomonas beringensis]|uniref:SecDF P1 head subdomain domain-containing protein n=1 Tax=Hyphomonas beringensis TaxID=1280946 RepID=A0A062UDN3_9PROT|nr:hypothetical protein [Hyphomonas beringensis]KCZ55823.1 hypothetical protein HY29_10695 [Hyphomonas beringensis]
MRNICLSILCAGLLAACDVPEKTLSITVPACRPPSVEQGILSIGDVSFDPGQVEAEAIEDALGRPALSIRLDTAGAEKLAVLTRDNIGQTLPLRVGDEVLMSPIVTEVISGGMLQVAGDFDKAELETLALRLSPPCDQDAG